MVKCNVVRNGWGERCGLFFCGWLLLLLLLLAFDAALDLLPDFFFCANNVNLNTLVVVLRGKRRE